MTRLEKVLYTGKTHTSGGRLDVALLSPGSKGSGTNPEQLFAAGWSACFIGAMGLATSQKKITLPTDLAVDAEVDLGMTGGGYFLQARLNVSLPGLERDIAQAIVDTAHQTCPYSKATRGNIDVTINLV
jgi:osmotically inducible protein OsmC